MNKSIQHPVEVILVTKANLFECLTSFKEKLSSPILDYGIFNCDFSTLSSTNPNREIVFTEIALCQKINTSQDISHRVFIYLLPSIKFNKYIPDSRIAFSSENLKYLMHNKSVYNLKDLTGKTALSYNNLNNEKLLSDSLSRILIDGKKSKKENMKSYYYYPKALKLHSLKFQHRLEEIIKHITMIITQEDYSNIPEEELNNSKYIIVPSIEETSSQMVNEILGFKWNLLFQPYTTDMIKIYIEGIELLIINYLQDNILIDKFRTFISFINNYFESNGQKELLPFSKSFDNAFYDNWRLFLLNEMKGTITLNHFNEQSGPMIDFRILKEEETKTEHISNYLNGLLLFIDSFLKDDDNNIITKSVQITNLFFNNWDFLSLLPLEIAKVCQIKYRFGLKLNMKAMKIDKEHIGAIMNKISYEKLYLNVDNKEEILFGYEFETELYKMLDEMKNKKNGYMPLKFEFGKDLQLLIQNKEFKAIIRTIANMFKIEDKKIGFSSYSVTYSIIDSNDIHIDTLRKSLCEIASKCKACFLIQEELGVSLFYQELFTSQAIIYGSNLYSKLSFIIQEIFNDTTNIINENQIKEFIIKRSLHLYDLNYISRINQSFSFYNQYMALGKDGIGNITLRFHYIINQIRDKITQSDKNCLSWNELYFNIKLGSLEPMKNIISNNNKTMTISKQIFKKNQLLSIAKTYGNIILNPEQDNESYRLEFLESEEKFKNLKGVIENLN